MKHRFGFLFRHEICMTRQYPREKKHREQQDPLDVVLIETVKRYSDLLDVRDDAWQVDRIQCDDDWMLMMEPLNFDNWWMVLMTCDWQDRPRRYFQDLSEHLSALLCTISGSKKGLDLSDWIPQLAPCLDVLMQESRLLTLGYVPMAPVVEKPVLTAYLQSFAEQSHNEIVFVTVLHRIASYTSPFIQRLTVKEQWLIALICQCLPLNADMCRVPLYLPDLEQTVYLVGMQLSVAIFQWHLTFEGEEPALEPILCRVWKPAQSLLLRLTKDTLDSGWQLDMSSWQADPLLVGFCLIDTKESRLVCASVERASINVSHQLDCWVHEQWQRLVETDAVEAYCMNKDFHCYALITQARFVMHTVFEASPLMPPLRMAQVTREWTENLMKYL